METASKLLNGVSKKGAECIKMRKQESGKCHTLKVKSCYNPLRLGTVIVLVSSGIDFVNTPRLYSNRATL